MTDHFNKLFKDNIQNHIGTARDCANYYILLNGASNTEVTIGRENPRSFFIAIKGEPNITNFKGERVTDAKVYAEYLDSGRASVELNVDSSAVIELVEVFREGKTNRMIPVDYFSSLADVKSKLKEFESGETMAALAAGSSLTTR